MKLVLAGLCAITFSGWTISSMAEEKKSGIAGLSREEALQTGENIYRKGMLPSGEPVIALVQGDIQVEGSMFSCESCHMRSGLGSYEGGVVTTPTNGATLYQSQFNVRQLTTSEMAKIPSYMITQYLSPPRRPAYSDETLATALRDGVDPTGRKLHSVMPRYLLNPRDMEILVYYLKSLSAEPSPGVTDTTIRFATVVTDDVTPEERNAVLAPLEKYVRGRNSKAESSRKRLNYGMFTETMDISYRKLALTRWELKGPPETWRRQLEMYYSREPVFAILGGITNSEWKPVHDFSEEHRIPCLFPITDYPVISDTDWYTLYFSKGFYQEGEAIARYLGTTINLSPDKTVVQVYRNNREGRASSAGFQETWQSLGRQPSVNCVLQAGEIITPELLQKLTDKNESIVVLLGVGPEAVSALESLAANTKKPEMVFISSTLLKEGFGKLPEQVRDFTYITYPYTLQHAKATQLKPDSAKVPQKINERRIPSKMYSAAVILTDALMMMSDDYYRDRFLEVIDMMSDKTRPYTDYERLSFGPGQRYASKGCYIVQVGKGPNPELVRKSDWVIH